MFYLDIQELNQKLWEKPIIYIYLYIYNIYIYLVLHDQGKGKEKECQVRNVFIVLFSSIAAIAFKEIIHFYPSNHSLQGNDNDLLN